MFIVCISIGRIHIIAKCENHYKNGIYTRGKVSIQYKTSGNNIVYAKATNGNDIGERIGNIIYLNGTKVATINEEAVTIEPRTGWMNADNCPLGSAADYNKLISERDVDVNLENSLLNYSTSALAIIIGLLVPSAALCASLAQLIISAAAGTKYEDAKTVYFHEAIYGHKTLPNFYRKVVCTYYFDKSHNEYAASDVYYKVWG